MNMRVNARLIIALLLVLAVFMSFSVGFAQDEDGDTSTEASGNNNTAQTADNTDVSAEPAGVGEIAQAADNFNVSAVPTQEQAQAAVTTPPLVEDTFSPEEIKQHEAAMQNAANYRILEAQGGCIECTWPTKYDTL